MRRQIKGYIRLVRCTEFFCFVIITTLVGAAAAKGVFGWRLIGVLAANWLAVAFAFMINDVADARDDALTDHKLKRNPVSSADLSPQSATIASFIIAALAVLVYALLGWWPLVIGLVTLLIGFLYSWRPVRFKDKPVVDLVTHGMMLAGLQFLAGYMTFETGISVGRWIFPFVFVVAVSIYGELFNELRDLEGDRKAGLNHTANLLGPRIAFWLMMGFLTLGVSSALTTVFSLRLFPTWVLLLLLSLAFLLVCSRLALRLHRRKNVQWKNQIQFQQTLQKPLEIAAAAALMAQFAGGWIVRFIPLHWF
jgi:4-hydroxybenzoate polyprenyltransferase